MYVSLRNCGAIAAYSATMHKLTKKDPPARRAANSGKLRLFFGGGIN